MADALQQMAIQEAQNRQQATGGKPGFIGPFPMEWNAGAGLGLQGKGLNLMGSMIMKSPVATGKAGSFGDKFLQAIQAAAAEVGQKTSGSFQILYAGNVTNGSSVSPGFTPGMGDGNYLA